MLKGRRQVVRRLSIGVLLDSAASSGVEVSHGLSRQRLRMGTGVVEGQLVGVIERGVSVEALEGFGDRRVQ